MLLDLGFASARDSIYPCVPECGGLLREQVNEIVAQQQNMSKELDVILEAYLAIHPK